MPKLRAKLNRYVSVCLRFALFRFCPLPAYKNNNNKKLWKTKTITRHAHTHTHTRMTASTESIYDIYANYANAQVSVFVSECGRWRLQRQHCFNSPMRVGMSQLLGDRHTPRMRNVWYSAVFLDIKQTLA